MDSCTVYREAGRALSGEKSVLSKDDQTNLAVNKLFDRNHIHVSKDSRMCKLHGQEIQGINECRGRYRRSSEGTGSGHKDDPRSHWHENQRVFLPEANPRKDGAIRDFGC